MKNLILPVTQLMQNCSIVSCEETGQAAVIDAGGDAERIRQAVERAGVTVEKLLLTHGHMDHAGAAAELAEYWDVPIEGPHRDDQFLLDTIVMWNQQFGLPPGRNVSPDRWLVEGDSVTVGKQTLEVLHCPGHTPGHVVFFHAQSRMAWVGDVLFQGAIGRTDFPRGDYATLLRSIREKLWPLGDDVTVVPGHGENSTIGIEKATNPYVR